MVNYLIPKEYVNSIQNIDLYSLKSKGIKGLVVDLDDTLLPRVEFRIPLTTYQWVEKSKELGFKISLVSNGSRIKRLKRITESLNIEGTALAFKPLPYAFNQVISKMGFEPDRIAVIGDQILTDVIGGNLRGMYTILVKPLSPEASLIRMPFRIFESYLVKLLGLRTRP
jgi:HAD superfamily phosphatase (TIGR01668 family)